ncbi:MAG TPA: SEC-C domain-containing protein [Usitatibacter sp.]|nr:SEC-C domain-containing protein [Usitatibacter sp.]
MANTRVPGRPKIGRNDPCFCGSGRKFKRCHGSPQYELPTLLAKQATDKMLEEARRQLEKRKLKEAQRQKQQGLGRPIISVEFQGYRFVAVANKMYYGKWKTFADFLSHYIKDVLGGDWGNSEIAKPLNERHPVMQWYDKICHLQAAHAKEKGALFTTPMTGAASAYNRLAYNLYLIAHNGKDIQTRLIARLRDKKSFQGAFFETQVAAWLIKAGFELEFEDESDRTSTHCEFTATHITTGEKFSVEAKSRELQSTSVSREKLVRKLHQALEKKANYKRLVFLNLNKPLHTPEAADVAMNRAERLVMRAEADTINGAPAPEAYICITNMNDQYILDTASVAMMALFRGFKIPDFMGSGFASFREAARAREKHIAMFQLFRSLEDHREIPQTFDGELPSEAFNPNPLPRLQVGETYLVPGPNGAEIEGTLVQAVVHADKASCIFRHPKTGETWLAAAPMTPEELADYARHPDTYFGANNPAQSRNAETAMDLFDFFVDAHRNTPRERLIELLKNAGSVENVDAMAQKDLVELYAEGCTYGAINSGAVPMSPRRKSAGASGADE